MFCAEELDQTSIGMHGFNSLANLWVFCHFCYGRDERHSLFLVLFKRLQDSTGRHGRFPSLLLTNALPSQWGSTAAGLYM
jgi:hypothetical protein